MLTRLRRTAREIAVAVSLFREEVYIEMCVCVCVRERERVSECRYLGFCNQKYRVCLTCGCGGDV